MTDPKVAKIIFWCTNPEAVVKGDPANLYHCDDGVDMASNGWLMFRKVEVPYPEVPADYRDEVRRTAIGKFEEEIKSVQANAEKTITSLRRKINTFLAIEHDGGPR